MFIDLKPLLQFHSFSSYQISLIIEHSLPTFKVMMFENLFILKIHLMLNAFGELLISKLLDIEKAIVVLSQYFKSVNFVNLFTVYCLKEHLNLCG